MEGSHALDGSLIDFYMTNGPMVAPRDKSVLISGIGVAGPALAYWLSLYGFKTVLVEKSPHLRTGGYVLDFWGRGFDVAEKMGILPTVKREGYYVKELRLVGASGQRVGGFSAEVRIDLPDYPVPHRAPFFA